MTITEYEPRLCTECNGTGMSNKINGLSTNVSVQCKLCGGTGKINIVRIISEPIYKKPREPPYEITC